MQVKNAHWIAQTSQHQYMCRKASVGMCSIKDVIIPINLICLLFDPAIPTSSFNFIHYNSMEHELGRFSELT